MKNLKKFLIVFLLLLFPLLGEAYGSCESEHDDSPPAESAPETTPEPNKPQRPLYPQAPSYGTPTDELAPYPTKSESAPMIPRGLADKIRSTPRQKTPEEPASVSTPRTTFKEIETQHPVSTTLDESESGELDAFIFWAGNYVMSLFSESNF